MENSESMIVTVGKRKRSRANAFFSSGNGHFLVNKEALETYFQGPSVAAQELQNKAKLPLELLAQNHLGSFEELDVNVSVRGGGLSAQAEAIQLAVARAIVKRDPTCRSFLKLQGQLTSNSAIKERKKYGLKKARKAPQFSKR